MRGGHLHGWKIEFEFEVQSFRAQYLRGGHLHGWKIEFEFEPMPFG